MRNLDTCQKRLPQMGAQSLFIVVIDIVLVAYHFSVLFAIHYQGKIMNVATNPIDQDTGGKGL